MKLIRIDTAKNESGRMICSSELWPVKETGNRCKFYKKPEWMRYRFTSLKNDKPRTIQPAPYVMNILREQRKAQIEERLRAGALWDEGEFPGLVFTTETGKHLCFAVVLRHYQKALERAGLPMKRFHDLRHTYAVSSLRAGDDVKTVQENLGHHTAAFTLDQYGHVTQTMREASARRMEAFIEGLK